MACPGSITLAAKAPKRPDSIASQIGTRAHECLERLIKNGEAKAGKTANFLLRTYDAQMVKTVRDIAEEVWAMVPEGAELESEGKTYLTHIDKDLWGTLDISVIEDFGTLQVMDLKYGIMPVEAEDNVQMLAYAIGKAHEHHYNFERVILTILQPRAYHDAGPIRSWETSIDTLYKYNQIFADAIRAAKRKNAKLNSGPHCFFCDAKTICKEYTPDATKSVRRSFAEPKNKKEARAQLIEFFGEEDSEEGNELDPGF